MGAPVRRFGTRVRVHQEEQTMGILDKLASLFGAKPGGGTDDAIHIYVECERCKSKVHVRLDRRHDISVREEGGYYVRKEIMDSKCFRLMAAEITFDSAYRVQRREVQGGRFLTQEEFESPPTG
jgi:hypothetical protein